MNKPVARVLILTAAMTLTGVSALPAQAKQGADDAAPEVRHSLDDTVAGTSDSHRTGAAKSPRVITRKMCGSFETKLKVSSEDSGAQVEYELDQNVNGQTWSLALKQNGSPVDSAKRTTRAPSGSLHWRVVTTGASNGTFTVVAKKGSTTCTIDATL